MVLSKQNVELQSLRFGLPALYEQVQCIKLQSNYTPHIL